jgi:hypothetical protein
LNQRLQWQLNNSTKELRFVSLSQNQFKTDDFYWRCFRKYTRSSQSDRLRSMSHERRSC